MSIQIVLAFLALVLSSVSLAVPNRFLLPASVILLAVAFLVGHWK